MISNQRFRVLGSALLATAPLATAAYWVAGCAAALGPGYTIVKQEITVQFVPTPEPAIRIDAVYQLRNTGNQPLSSLELRLPGRRRFHFSDPRAEWDKRSLNFESSPDNPRNVVLTFPQSWTVSSRHTLHLAVEYQPATTETNLSFTPDAFFLPAQGWSPELLPSRGLFPTGGVPPQKWDLSVQVPEGFLVHTSGHLKKRQSKLLRAAKTQVLRALQDPKDGYPFVVAGRFQAVTLQTGPQKVNLWTRSPQSPEALRQPSEALVRAIRAYDSMFGKRLQESDNLWIVECPVVTGCFSTTVSAYENLIATENEKTSAEMASLDTVMVDLTGGPPEIAAAAPSLASSWLGYGRNPGFFEQDPPLSALPIFAASRGRDAALGSDARAQTIRRLLRAIPATVPARQSESGNALRAKSFLFFYGLQDRYGPQVLDAALRHMLDARRARGFNLADLIAAFEQESHQNVAEFVRLWMKHPGLPEEFRARYENSASSASTTKEIPE